MKRFVTPICIATALCAVSALATAADLQRVRGSISDFDNSQLTLHTRSGETTRIDLGDKTAYVYVVKSSLSKINKDDFIGTATKDQDGKLVALEVVIFPESMRGTGEGHYAWDKLPDYPANSSSKTASSMTNGNVQSTTSSGGQGKVSSSMTNGNVESTSSGGGQGKVSSSMTNGNVESTSSGGGQGKVSSSMTNGNIQSSQKSDSGGKQITVTYKGGKKQITVPDSAPIVAFEKADRSALKNGAQTFVLAAKDNGKLKAKLVAVGKNGVKPPM